MKPRAIILFIVLISIIVVGLFSYTFLKKVEQEKLGILVSSHIA